MTGINQGICTNSFCLFPGLTCSPPITIHCLSALFPSSMTGDTTALPPLRTFPPVPNRE